MKLTVCKKCGKSFAYEQYNRPRVNCSECSRYVSKGYKITEKLKLKKEKYNMKKVFKWDEGSVII